MKTIVKVPLDQLVISNVTTAVCSGVELDEARAVLRAVVENDELWRSIAQTIPRLVAVAYDKQKPPVEG